MQSGELPTGAGQWPRANDPCMSEPTQQNLPRDYVAFEPNQQSTLLRPAPIGLI